MSQPKNNAGKDIMRRILADEAPQPSRLDLPALSMLFGLWDDNDEAVKAQIATHARAQLSRWIEEKADFVAERQKIIEAFPSTLPDEPNGLHQAYAQKYTAIAQPFNPSQRRTLVTDTLARWLWCERRKLSEEARRKGDIDRATELYRFDHHAAWEAAHIAVSLETQARTK